jgi:hypothetical protein
MERLKKVIAQYGRWADLTIYAERIEAHMAADFSHALENAKALLETIGKEICDAKQIDLGKSPSINAVLKSAFVAIGYNKGDLVAQISGSLANIGQNIGNLRNEISPTSHGKSLEELKERNNKVDELTRDFLIDSTVIVAVFLIRAFENENPRIKPAAVEAKPLYPEFESFNDYWDDSFGEFEMGSYSFPASEILFYVDNKAYRTEQQAFAEGEDGADH